MKNLLIFIGLFLFVIVAGCEKQQTDFRDFFDNHEIVYTGSVADVLTRSGNLKTQLKWKSSSDPSIVKYVVYWNNKVDSQVVAINGKTDSVFVTIQNLEEFVYSFTIFSYDSKGNRSVPKEINGVKVYGDIYKNGLLNRAYNAVDPYIFNSDGSVTLSFNTPDTVNVGTVIKYTNTSGSVVEKTLSPESNSIVLPNYKRGTEVQYLSSYMPERNSLDVFSVSAYSTYPTIYALEQCDKSKFAEVYLPKDVKIYNGDECPVRKLWDGSVGPQGYPNIFHSADGSKIPQVFTFDMGMTYERLSVIEETGRNCCGNPLKFEVWGIDNLTNAETTLDASEAGWKAESVSKGWTLLREVIRTDDGKEAMKFNLVDNAPPVRYIRIRITEASGSNSTANMSELTFWSKQL